MSIISLDDAKAHLRADDGEDALIQAYMDAAEESASQFLNRAIYADDAAMEAARTAALTTFVDGLAAIEDRITTANAVEDVDQREQILEAIDSDRLAVTWAYRSAMAGIVINPAIMAACLLILGKLYANREDVVTGKTVAELPGGAHALLWPSRIGLGV